MEVLNVVKFVADFAQFATEHPEDAWNAHYWASHIAHELSYFLSTPSGVEFTEIVINLVIFCVTGFAIKTFFELIENPRLSEALYEALARIYRGVAFHAAMISVSIWFIQIETSGQIKVRRFKSWSEVLDQDLGREITSWSQHQSECFTRIKSEVGTTYLFTLGR